MSKDKSRNGKTSVRRHVLGVHKKEKHECEICHDNFARKTVLELHKARKHGGSSSRFDSFSCSYCDYKATMKWLLNRHVGAMHENKRVACPLCPYTGHDRKAAQVHVKRNHNKLGNAGIKEPQQCFPADLCGGRKQSCLFCSYDTKDRQDMQLHVMIRHINPSSYNNQHEHPNPQPSSIQKSLEVVSKS